MAEQVRAAETSRRHATAQSAQPRSSTDASPHTGTCCYDDCEFLWQRREIPKSTGTESLPVSHNASSFESASPQRGRLQSHEKQSHTVAQRLRKPPHTQIQAHACVRVCACTSFRSEDLEFLTNRVRTCLENEDILVCPHDFKG